MKKYICLILIGIAFVQLNAQEVRDALRYTQDNITGTARFRAMSGAFGALGGDLSSLSSNPAGSAIFANNQIAFTLNNNSVKNDADYFGTSTSDSKGSFTLNQIGGVFSFKNSATQSDWKKFSFAINYERTNNFNNSTFAAGANPTRSIDSYFLYYAAGVPLELLENSSYQGLEYYKQKQAFLGYQTYMINPQTDDPNNTVYTSNVPTGGNYYQVNRIDTKGYNGKVIFNAATLYDDRLYLGINLNSHFVDYRQISSFYEDNGAPLTSDYTVSRLRFDNNLYTYGGGFSFQLGAIAKITNGLRLGLAYESPTWYRLTDELSQKLAVTRERTIKGVTEEVKKTADPEVTIIYEPYRLQTPSKWTGSLAYIFGKKGLFSIDYAIKDYSNAKFKPGYDYSDVNSEISTLLTTVSELRIGAEYKIEAWSIRAGYRQEQSPYKNKITVGDLTGYSTGLGYNFGGTKLDLAYTLYKRNSNVPFFERGLTDGASINSKIHTIALTLLFEL